MNGIRRSIWMWAATWGMLLAACSKNPSDALQQRVANPSEARFKSLPRVEVVASVIGYTTRFRLPTGETVLQVIPSAEEVGFDAHGFIFCVLQPTEFAGRIFSIHHDGLMASGDPVETFDTQVRYRLLVPEALISHPDAGCSAADIFPRDGSRTVDIQDPEHLRVLVEVLRHRGHTLDARITAAKEAVEEEKRLRPDSNRTIRRLEIDLGGWERRRRLLADRIAEAELRMAANTIAGGKRPNKAPEPTPTAVTPRADVRKDE